MKGIIYITLLLLPVFSFAQHITYSEPLREDNREINFDVIGKMKNNIIVFKNAKWKYAVTVYNADDMSLKEKIDLDFIPDKAFNVDYIAFPDNFYFIYQYQRWGIVYCMGAKMDLNGHIIGEPMQLDTTHVGALGDNKIYSTINSDDKKQIMIFKIQKKDDQFHFVTLLLDGKLQFVHKSRLSVPYDDHNDVYSDFLLDNEGNFVFSKSVKSSSRSLITSLYLVTKAPQQDTFSTRKLDLRNLYIDEVKMKVDNINKRYIFNSFYYTEKRGNIDGIFSSVWDVKADSIRFNVFTKLDDSIRNFAKSKGSLKLALNDFFIRNIILKKDGSYLLAAEDYSSQTSGNNMGWNRWDYLYGSPYLSPYSYYYYSPSYGGYYRPYNRFNSNQSTRYYYDNILLLDISKTGEVSSSKMINKEQYGDDNDNYLSFSTFITESEIHFLFNLLEKRDKLLTDNTLTANGTIRRNPTIKSIDRGYEYMPKLAKQIGARQIIIPCTFRNQICFAKIDF
ncbi:MAG: hypothetical protein ABIQ31_03395 [Ferruginibacter sp.]